RGGHSVGSAIAIAEAGTYRDVDGVLVTGLINQMNLVSVVPALTSMIPVTLDPRPGKLGLDLGYLTTAPRARYDTFHKPGPHNAAVIDHEESTKDAYTAGEVVTTVLLNNVLIQASRAITAPAMSAQSAGDHFCGRPLGSDCSSSEALAASERPFFPRAPRLDAFVLNGYGHCFNFALNSRVYHAAVVAWQRSI
ncbi:alpha/beta hydrolase, partial [Lentzea sp. CC55]|nr:alpha/beta hydrolase [Lentzea sp. CC55]